MNFLALGIKLNKDPAAQNHENLAWVHEHIQTVAQNHENLAWVHERIQTVAQNHENLAWVHGSMYIFRQ